MGNLEIAKDDQIVNSIRQIVARYGRDVLKDGQRFCSLLTELIPDKKRELKIIKIIFDEGTGKEFLDISEKEDVDKIVDRLVNECFLDHKVVVEAVSWFVDALCGNCDTDSEENKPKSSQSNDGVRNTLLLKNNDWENHQSFFIDCLAIYPILL